MWSMLWLSGSSMSPSGTAALLKKKQDSGPVSQGGYFCDS